MEPVTSACVLGCIMRKQTFCICENKGADQLRSICEADQRLYFRYTVSTIPLHSKFKISSFYSHLLCLHSSVCVGPDRKLHCWFFSRPGSFFGEDKLGRLPADGCYHLEIYLTAWCQYEDLR